MHLYNLVKQYYTPGVKQYLLGLQITYATMESLIFLKKEYHIKPDMYDFVTIGGLIGTPMTIITHLVPKAPLTVFPLFFLWQKSCEQTINKIRK